MTDYIHLQNLIMTAVEKISTHPDIDKRGAHYGDLIDFLETMYVNSVMSLVGSILTMAKASTNPEEVDEMLLSARMLMEQPEAGISHKMSMVYKTMITELNLPDAYQTKTHNEKVADDIRETIATPSDSPPERPERA